MIPEAAVEAALSKLIQFTGAGTTFRDIPPMVARHILEAAAPHMLAEAKAEAWDEGLAAGLAEWDDHQDIGNEPPNPYRSA